MLGKSLKTLLSLTVAALVLVALPFVLENSSQYYVYLVTKLMIWTLFAMSFNLVLGYGGMMSFGHAAFFGAGAYTCATHSGENVLPHCSRVLGRACRGIDHRTCDWLFQCPHKRYILFRHADVGIVSAPLYPGLQVA